MIGNLGMKQVMSFQKNWGATYFCKNDHSSKFCSQMMLLRLLQNDIRAQQQLLFDYNWGPTDIYGIHLDFNSKGKKSSVPIRGECVFKVLIFDPFLPFSPLLTTSTERVVYSWKSQILPSWTSIASGRQMALIYSRLHHQHHLSFQFGQTTRLWLQSILVELQWNGKET